MSAHDAVLTGTWAPKSHEHSHERHGRRTMSEARWIARYLSLKTIAAVTVVIVGGLFTFMTWTVEHSAAENQRLHSQLDSAWHHIDELSGYPDKLAGIVDRLTRENKTLEDAKAQLMSQVTALKDKIAALTKENHDLKKQLDAVRTDPAPAATK